MRIPKPMNRRQIITADLLARVQWGVKCETTKWQNNGQGKPMSKAVGKLIGYSERTGYEVVFNEDDFAEDFDKVKPLLFSSLTEPITVAGETFVPITELAYIALGQIHEWDEIFESDRVYVCRNPRIIFQFDMDKGMFTVLHRSHNEWGKVLDQVKLFDFMHRNHVNYRLLPGEYIPATNEYD